jgi:hypothetical protein
MTAREATHGRRVFIGRDGQSISFNVSGYAYDLSDQTDHIDWDANWLRMSYTIDWEGEFWERTVETELTWYLPDLPTFFEVAIKKATPCEWSDNEVALSLVYDPSVAPEIVNAELWPDLQQGSFQRGDAEAVVLPLQTSAAQLAECLAAAKEMCGLWPVRGASPTNNRPARPGFRP